MPFPEGVGKLTFSGTHGQGEIWSFGMHIVPIVFTEDIMDDLETAARAMYSDAASNITSSSFLTEIKYAQLDTNGKYASDDQPYIREVNPSEQGGRSQSYVPQATIVVSLSTGSKRGLAHAGRYYMPPTSVQAGAEGLLSAASVSEIMLNQKGFLNAINTALAPSYIVVASSRGAGAIKKVTGIRVGNVIDTQRRRRNALVETYLEDSLA